MIIIIIIIKLALVTYDLHPTAWWLVLLNV